MVKPECSHFLDEIGDLHDQIVTLQEDLAHARGSDETGVITRQINKLRARVTELRTDFDKCEGIPPLPAPIQASMPSAITMATSDSRFPSLGPVSPTLTFTFSQQGFNQIVMGFPSTVLGTFSVTFLGVPVFSNTVIARVASGGQGSYVRGDDSLSIPTDFALDHTALGTSTFSMTLTTGTVSTSLPPGSLTGMPISRSPASRGRVALVGASVLSDAFAGTVITAIIRGTLTSFPP